MTDDTFGDAFDTAAEPDEANALFRRAETLDDTMHYAEGLYKEAGMFSNPVIQGEQELAHEAWEKSEELSGGHTFAAAAEGFQEITHDDPRELWQDMKPDNNFAPYLEPAMDQVGTVALAGAQDGIGLITSLAPGSELTPAIEIAEKGYDEAKAWTTPDDSGHFKDPEIPETDAVGANVTTDAVTPDVDGMIAAYSDTSGYDTATSTDTSATDTSSDSTSYDTSTSTDTASYDASSYDTSSYDTSGSDTATYDTSSSDVASVSTTDESGSSGFESGF